MPAPVPEGTTTVAGQTLRARAVSGVLVGAVPFALGRQNPGNPAWLGAAVVGSIALLSAVSAVGSVLLARMAKNRKLRGARANLA